VHLSPFLLNNRVPSNSKIRYVKKTSAENAIYLSADNRFDYFTHSYLKNTKYFPLSYFGNSMSTLMIFAKKSYQIRESILFCIISSFETIKETHETGRKVKADANITYFVYIGQNKQPAAFTQAHVCPNH
jgi:hypothetical protein